MSGEFMATNKKLMPPTPTHSAWVAFAVVFPALLVALLSCPIWMSAYGAMRLMKRLRRRFKPMLAGRRAPISGRHSAVLPG
jgi:hypothetical protein